MARGFAGMATMVAQRQTVRQAWRASEIAAFCPDDALLCAPHARYIGTMWEEQPGAGEALLFEAVIVPHRSLSRRGLIILLSVIAGLCGLTMLRFWLLGAWPVIAFSLVEVGIAAGLLVLNARQARGSELVMLTENCVRVVRTDSRGRRQQRQLSAAWLNVVLVEAPGRIPRLLLSARDAREEIGAVLGEAEKRDLATALRSALHHARNPRFDNPQLREV